VINVLRMRRQEEKEIEAQPYVVGEDVGGINRFSSYILEVSYFSLLPTVFCCALCFRRCSFSNS
jgi:hypothetical protein